MLACCTVNHRMPSCSNVERVRIGLRTRQLYSVTVPVFGSSLPISPALLPVNQILPSRSSLRPCGPVCGLDRVFADRTGLGIDATQLVGQLAGPPDRAVPGGERIVRTRAERRHIEQLDRCLHRTRDDRGGRPRLLGEIFHQIGDDRRPVLRRDRRVEVLHHVLEHVPAGRRIAGAGAVDVVAAAASLGEALLHRPFGPVLGGVLGVGWIGLHEHGEQDGTGECLEDHSGLPECGVLRRLCLVVGASLAQKQAGRYCEAAPIAPCEYF